VGDASLGLASFHSVYWRFLAQISWIILQNMAETARLIS